MTLSSVAVSKDEFTLAVTFYASQQTYDIAAFFKAISKFFYKQNICVGLLMASVHCTTDRSFKEYGEN